MANVQVVKSHEEKECSLRPVTCSTCKQPIAVSQLFDHVMTFHQQHSDDFVFGDVIEYGLERKICEKKVFSQIPLRETINDLKFFYNHRSYDKNLAMFWVSHVGTQMEADQYQYTLKIENAIARRAERSEYLLFAGTRDCVSCDVSHEDMKAKGDALFLNKDLLKKAVNGSDGKIHYTLVINKK